MQITCETTKTFRLNFTEEEMKQHIWTLRAIISNKNDFGIDDKSEKFVKCQLELCNSSISEE